MRYLKKLLPFILLLFVILLIRVNTYNFPFERDEGEHAYIAFFAKQGVVPYRDVFDQKPPMIFLVYFFGEMISPGGTWGPRVLAAISTFATAVLVYFVGKKQFGKFAGLLSMWLFVAMLTIPEMTPFSANTEIFMLPFLLGSYYIFINFSMSEKKSPWFFFGTLSFIAIMFKPICTPLIMYIFILWIFKYLNNRSTKGLLPNIISAVLGSAVVLIPILLYLILNDALKPFFDTVIVYNFYYSRSFLGEGLSFFATASKGILIAFPAVFALIILFLVNNKQKLKYFVGLFFFLLIPIYYSPILHYYLITIPFLALYASAGFVYLLKRYKIKQPSTRLALVLILIFSTVGINLITIVFSKENLFRRSYLPNPFQDSIVFSKVLARYSQAEDKILMLANEPQVLYYSKRKSASRFFYIYPLLIPTQKARDYENEYVSDLLNKKPEFIVFSPYVFAGTVVDDTTDHFINSVSRIIADNYKVVGGFGSGTDGGWTEKIDPINVSQYSFILFEKSNRN